MEGINKRECGLSRMRLGGMDFLPLSTGINGMHDDITAVDISPARGPKAHSPSLIGPREVQRTQLTCRPTPLAQSFGPLKGKGGCDGAHALGLNRPCWGKKAPGQEQDKTKARS